MTRYQITVEPHSSLFVGGYAENQGQSDGDSASDPHGLLLPGSTIKGALREAAIRLVNGAGKGEKELQQLFGVEKGPPPVGGDEEHDHLRFEGKIRILPLRAAWPTPAAVIETGDEAPPRPAPLALRHHVSLDRATRQAAPGRLFQNRVTPAGQALVFRGEVHTRGDLNAEQEGLLRLATQLTDQVGGGRGRGLGHVQMTLETIEEHKPARPFSSMLPTSGGQANDQQFLVLELEAVEPLHLGVVKDATNLVTSKESIDGSTLRGAVAAFVAHTAPASAVLDLLENLMGPRHPVQFGDAFAGHPAAVPAPLTLWESKGKEGKPRDLAAALASGRGSHRLFDHRSAKGTWIPTDNGGWRKQSLRRRTVTRTARNVINGRGDEGRLFSLEVVDPMLGPATACTPLRFYAPVQGTAEQLHWVVRAAEEGIQVGRARTRGFGHLQLVGVAEGAAHPALEVRHQRWVDRLRTIGVPNPHTYGVFFALGPIALNARRLKNSLAAPGLSVVSGTARRRAHGGWNRKAGLPRNLGGHFVPGSTWIVQHKDCALDALKHLEKQGLGPGRADGWGRVAVCHGLHVDAAYTLDQDEKHEDDAQQEKKS
jgi:CRISPR/Cas system CSM-associated protein Csm3 (group 7 of RAMP superfamily)